MMHAVMIFNSAHLAAVVIRPAEMTKTVKKDPVDFADQEATLEVSKPVAPTPVNKRPVLLPVP